MAQFAVKKTCSGASLHSQKLHCSVVRKKWADEAMENATKDVLEGTLSVRHAAAQYDIPPSTLHDHISGKVSAGAVSGAPRYLDEREEKELVEFLLGCAEVGYPKTVKEVRVIVGKIIAKKQKQDVETIAPVSHGWWEKFQKRHQELSLRSSESLSQRRAMAMNPAVLNRYFDLLEDTVKGNNLHKRPALIFNCDESGFPLAHRPGKRIAGKGQKHVLTVTSDSKSRVTVLACINAAGYAIPPLIIYARANLTKPLYKGEIPGTMYSLSPGSGWMDGATFYEWFEQHFLEYAPSGRPLLLLLDGHSSHYNPTFIRFAAEKGVIVFALPPNTTHISQPLDSVCFKALKQCWDEQCNLYMSSNPGKIVTIYQFSELFAAAWRKAMNPQNISSSFRTTGVFPVDRQALEILQEKEKSLPKLSMAVVAKSNGINFLPLYSPRKSLVSKDITPVFTEEEMKRFQKRFDEGFDVPGDSHYLQWLQLYHPECNSPNHSPNATKCTTPVSTDHDENPPNSHCGKELPVQGHCDNTEINLISVGKGKLDSFLKVPTPLANRSKAKPRGAKVLTSQDYLEELEQKEKLKKEKEEQKEQKRRQREQKVKLKASGTAQRQKASAKCKGIQQPYMYVAIAVWKLDTMILCM